MRRILPYLKGMEMLGVLAVAALNAAATFLSGGYFIGPLTLCVTGSWAILIFLVLARTKRGLFDRPMLDLGPAMLLACLWLWAGLSMTWSIAPDLSWLEFNRTGGYLAIFLAGIIVSDDPSARKTAPALFLCVAAAAAIYGLGPKTFPSIVENAQNLGRISVPVGYTNAVGLLMALAYPVSLFYAARRTVMWPLRLAAILSGPLLLVCLFFSLSRGAAIALAMGLIVYFSIVPGRLRSFGIMSISLIPSILIARWSAAQEALMDNYVDAGMKIPAAASLRWYLAGALAASGAIFLLGLVAARKVRFPALVKNIAGFLIITSMIVTLLTGASVFVSSQPSFTEWAAGTYESFRYGIPSQAGAGRLFEMGSSGRWSLWEEANSNWKDKPLTGTGGQSFPLVHLALRNDSLLYVKQPHSLVFRLMAELGTVGLILGTSLFFWIQARASKVFCCQSKIRDRALAGTILAVLTVYLVHTAYDWDWNMYALTMVYFFFAGIMMGWPLQPTRAKGIIRRGRNSLR